MDGFSNPNRCWIDVVMTMSGDLGVNIVSFFLSFASFFLLLMVYGLWLGLAWDLSHAHIFYFDEMNEKWHPKFGMTLMFVYIIYKLLVGCILQSFLLQLLYGLLTFGHLNVDSFFSSNDIGIQFQLVFGIWNIFIKDYNQSNALKDLFLIWLLARVQKQREWILSRKTR